MESYDLEIGPIQKTFEALFKTIGQYFQGAPVEPAGSITETDLSSFSQEQLRNKTLSSILFHFGFFHLTFFLKVTIDETSQIGGNYRSDNIAVYEEKAADGSHRTYNFHSSFGSENMKVSCIVFGYEKRRRANTRNFNSKRQMVLIPNDDIYYLKTEKAKTG